MAKRWVIGGLAVGMGALVLAPETRTWLRRRLGLEPEDRRWFEEEGVENAEHEGDEPLDTREARFSLRARLAEEGHAAPVEEAPPAAAEPAPAPEPSAFPAFPSEPAPPSFPAFEQSAPAPEEPAAEEPDIEEPDIEEPVFEEPAAEPPTEPRPIWPSAAPDLPPVHSGAPELEPDPDAPSAPSFEAVPAITPEADEPRAPGEDTNEIDPLPPTRADQAAKEQGTGEDEDDVPPPPPTMLRPPTSPAPRPFSSDGPSFRSAIDAARERVHGAAREATPDDEGENTEPLEDRS
jgi:hypothetical protein